VCVQAPHLQQVTQVCPKVLLDADLGLDDVRHGGVLKARVKVATVVAARVLHGCTQSQSRNGVRSEAAPRVEMGNTVAHKQHTTQLTVAKALADFSHVSGVR